ncbi:MAG: hypothetical protein DME89_07265 [Verrucomicrobia bacterium]|nr:MAG: hypothetical protein DME89_07265 [Verrucomicrobiota bacterium]
MLAPKARIHREPGAAPQASGHPKSASAESAIHSTHQIRSNRRIETRYQRLFALRFKIPGATPQANHETAPLALSGYD